MFTTKLNEDNKKDLLEIKNTSKNKTKNLPLELLVNIFNEANNLFFNNLLICYSKCYWKKEIGGISNKTLNTTKQLKHCFEQAKHLLTSSGLVYLFVGEMFRKTKNHNYIFLTMSECQRLFDLSDNVIKSPTYKDRIEDDTNLKNLTEYYKDSKERYLEAKAQLKKAEKNAMKASSIFLEGYYSSDQTHQKLQNEQEHKHYLKPCGHKIWISCKCQYIEGCSTSDKHYEVDTVKSSLKRSSEDTVICDTKKFKMCGCSFDIKCSCFDFPISFVIDEGKEPEKDSDYNNFQLTDELKIKWEEAIQNGMFLYNYAFPSMQHARFDMVDNNYKDSNSAYLLLLSKYKDKVPNLRLKLQHPQNIEQMLNLRYWFNKLSKCFFENIVVEQALLNWRMIDLLFDRTPNILFNTTTFFMYGGYAIYGYSFMNSYIISKGVYLENKYSFHYLGNQIFGKKIKEEERRVSKSDFGRIHENSDMSLPTFARVAEYEFFGLREASCRDEGKEPEKDSDYNNFQLTDELKIKWKEAIQNGMILYNYPRDIGRFDILNINYKRNNSAYLLLLSKDKDKVPNLRLKLQHPENIEQMLNLRYWFNKLSKCYFENIIVEQAVLNYRMIDLLFDGTPNILFNANTFFMYGDNDFDGFDLMNNYVVSKGVYLENKYSFHDLGNQIFGKKIKEEERPVSMSDFGSDKSLPTFARVAEYEFFGLRKASYRGMRMFILYNIGSNRSIGANYKRFN
ncbi:hypothetical protein Mgra_00000586 [Meloidogyne graminicola]|uniref:Uncharacterized protein n=1 Tax=Meloidogyne graminicola TaxID=189291 RepID=A0A8T0A3L2_9BILA|nr:hypothetical protein Mgra_00000586 [Meloidogyne graminicola]